MLDLLRNSSTSMANRGKVRLNRRAMGPVQGCHRTSRISLQVTRLLKDPAALSLHRHRSPTTSSITANPATSIRAPRL